ncbi:uncharacterized protein LOC141589778 [Silene latifolia]|uniref:uncharacterized protein LOC141589778 n=1 Tax=Silene latifolia TaxID=37657 RepID=UPI003D78196E
MRAMRDPAFSDFVLRVGDGSPPYENGKDIKLPRPIVISETEENVLIDRLIAAVYPDIHLITANPSLITGRGEAFTYKSFDEAADVAMEQYPTKFLNTLQPSGLPPHELVLKRNCPVILLRNLDPTSGLYNGTQLICRAFARNVIDAEIVVEHHKGQRVFIARIPLQPSPTDKFPFHFIRKQFPIKLSFAMTINKSQGHTLNRVGIYLPRLVFSHGQLYVALSRATQSSDITVVVLPHCALTDSWRRSRNIGTEMPDVIFQEDIGDFKDILHEGHQYEIKNPFVKMIPEQFKFGNQNYQIQLRGGLHIIDLGPTETRRTYWVPVNSANENLERNDKIDLLGIAIYVQPLRQASSTLTGNE